MIKPTAPRRNINVCFYRDMLSFFYTRYLNPTPRKAYMHFLHGVGPNAQRNEKSVIVFMRARQSRRETLTQTLGLLILISGLQPHEYMVDRLVHGIRRYLRYFRVYL